MKAFSTTCLFFTANCCTWFYHFLVWYTLLCNLCRELLWEALLFMIHSHCPEVARGQDVISATQPVTADSTWKTWPQPVAARVLAGWWHYAKISLHGITERKRRAASCSWSVFLSYNLICMWAFRAPLTFRYMSTFLKPSNSCHVGINWIALIEYSQMSTNVPGFQSLFRIFCIILYWPNLGQISQHQRKG